MPLMPPLPKKRVNESAPFIYTGVDYFGPIFVKSDTGSKKVWVCLYTCLVVGAIHLELMQDMSAEKFLLGFRRFIARWGNPKQIISDNGSQFKLASNTLEEAWNGIKVNSDVQTYMANEGIQWQFIVELAPWMGGFYERLIGIVKRCLRKTIGKQCLTNEKFRSLLAGSEAVNCQQTIRSGRIQYNTPAKVGDIVLIKDNLPRGSWKIGRIYQLVVSRDGQIRSGKVILPYKKTLNRALNMLYPIECEEANEDLTNSDTEKDTELINDNINTTRERPQRQAAQTAMKKIKYQLES
ncbi:unnamed protein product [Mytilus coruscus]|uniref:Integrase catalytic domain-containing protein n=1 Tax=Mytilus coruscus TaxID=42192 RepID=A0A6J8C3W4_MYTCO|nr:unnamed protein product [Mytilus coruscus]